MTDQSTSQGLGPNKIFLPLNHINNPFKKRLSSYQHDLNSRQSPAGFTAQYFFKIFLVHYPYFHTVNLRLHYLFTYTTVIIS